MKKKLLIPATVCILLVTAFFITAVVPAKYDEISREAGTQQDYNEYQYDRKAVRAYAEKATASENLKNGDFRYLSPNTMDRATNCANFVSQCLWAGGYEMTGKWYMKKYSDSVPQFKRITDKIFTTGRRFVSGSFGIGSASDYTDMNYAWSLTWSCAGVQLEYGRENYFEGVYEAGDIDEFYEIVEKENVRTGDIIFQSPENIHHVLIVSDVSDDGTVYFASHNPPLFDIKIDIDAWKKHGFSGGVLICKVRDSW